MYSTAAVSRPEISAFLEQAQGAEKFFIAQRLFPTLGRKTRAGRYPVIKIAKGDLMRRQQTKRSSSGRYNEATQEHEWDTYDCEDRGLEQRIDDTKAAEMKDFVMLEKLASGNVRRKCLLDFEVNAATMLQSSAVFAETAASVAYTEANIATIDFPLDMQAAIEQVTGRGETVNTIMIPHLVFNRLVRTTLMQQYLYGKLGNTVQKRLITTKDVGEAFSLDAGEEITIVIGRSKEDVSNKGRATVSLTPIWKTTHIWLGNVQGGDFEKGGMGRTLVWEADVPGGLFASETYRDEGRRSDMVRVRTNSIEKIVNENCGQLIATSFA